jgi:beta-1,4-mannosyltransferase
MRILASPALALRSLNPYSFLLYSNMRAEVVEYSWRACLHGSYEIFHLHWPETELNTLGPIKAYLQLKKKLLMIDYLRRRGTRVIWTVHNLHSHECRHPRIERWFWRAFTHRLDAFLVLSSSALEPAVAAFPHLKDIPAFVTPHGHYRDEYPAGISRREARQVLGIGPDSKVLLAFGQVRPYKNVDLTLAAFHALSGEHLVLLIAGECRDAVLRERLLALARADDRIRFVPEHVRVNEVQLYMNAADLVVLPYSDILNSGSALLALSFNRPVLVPDRDAMRDLRSTVGEPWVRIFSGELNAAVLEEALEWALCTGHGDTAPLEPFAWPAIADQTLSAFYRIAAQPRRG